MKKLVFIIIISSFACKKSDTSPNSGTTGSSGTFPTGSTNVVITLTREDGQQFSSSDYSVPGSGGFLIDGGETTGSSPIAFYFDQQIQGINYFVWTFNGYGTHRYNLTFASPGAASDSVVVENSDQSLPLLFNMVEDSSIEVSYIIQKAVVTTNINGTGDGNMTLLFYVDSTKSSYIKITGVFNNIVQE